MPRLASSIQRSSLVSPPPPPRPRRHFPLPLKAYEIRTRKNKKSTTWALDPERPDRKLILYLGVADALDNFTICVRDQDNTIWLEGSVPVPKGDIEVRMFESTFLIDVRIFARNTRTVVNRWLFTALIERNSVGLTNKVWNLMADRLSHMSLSQLRYVNIPRSHATLLPVASTQRYALRARKLDQVLSVANMTIDLPHNDVKSTYTMTIPLPEMQALTYWILSKLVLQPPAPAPATTERLLDLSTVCGKCHKGDVPIEPAQIKRRRAGKEWIGCENGLNCPQHNFWFHLTRDCAGLSAAEAPKKKVWWCVECRKNRPNASEIGLETRSRI